MTKYPVQLRDKILAKGYRFLFFAKNMGKSIGKNITKNLSGKHKNFLIMLNSLQQMRLKRL